MDSGTSWRTFGWPALEDVWPEIPLAWLAAAAATAAFWLL